MPKILVERYKRDAKLKFPALRQYDERPRGGGLRKKIVELSEKASSLLRFRCRNLPDDLKYMITLTYPKKWPKDGRKIKKHFRYFMKYLHDFFGDFRYFWILEFQKRGAPHFHIVVDFAAVEFVQKISKLWYNIVGSRDKKHLKAGVWIEIIRKSVSRYFYSYLKKETQKKVPRVYQNVGRFWGCSHGLCSPVEVFEYNFSNFYALFDFAHAAFVERYKFFCSAVFGFEWMFSGQGFTFYDFNFFFGLI